MGLPFQSAPISGIIPTRITIIIIITTTILIVVNVVIIIIVVIIFALIFPGKM